MCFIWLTTKSIKFRNIKSTKILFEPTTNVFFTSMKFLFVAQTRNES